MAADKDHHGETASLRVDTGLVRELAELLNETGLTEIEVEDGERKIRVSRGGAAHSSTPMPVTTFATAPLAAAGTMPPGGPDETSFDSAKAIRSPMVGTVYLAADPGGAPFVRKGDRVKAGDTLLIVEAMKVMNPIHATSDGLVEDVLVENGQPVEFDQPLIVVG